MGVAVDERGLPESGVLVSVRMVEPPSGSGVVYDGVKNSDVSDANGGILLVVARGATYRAKRGSESKRWSAEFVVPSEGDASFPNFIGID